MTNEDRDLTFAGGMETDSAMDRGAAQQPLHIRRARALRRGRHANGLRVSRRRRWCTDTDHAEAAAPGGGCPGRCARVACAEATVPGGSGGDWRRPTRSTRVTAPVVACVEGRAPPPRHTEVALEGGGGHARPSRRGLMGRGGGEGEEKHWEEKGDGFFYSD